MAASRLQRRRAPAAVGDAVIRLWCVLAVLLVGGALSLGCSSTPAAKLTVTRPPDGNLKVHVTSVTGTLEPYNPQLTNHGIPAEQVDFTVNRGPGTTVPESFSCNIEVFHLGRNVGSTTVSIGAPPGYPSSSQSVSVEVRGQNYSGSPSDAHVACRAPVS